MVNMIEIEENVVLTNTRYMYTIGPEQSFIQETGIDHTYH